MLRSAVEHYRRQQRIVAAAIRAARRYWAAGNLEALAAMVAQSQNDAATDAAAAVPLMLAEQGFAAQAIATVIPAAFAGIASDGRGLLTLFEQANSRRTMTLMVATQLQDAARVSAGVAIASRPDVIGYVRMLNPPSCSRCIVLAGKFYRWNTGFERHPMCDCRHVPVADEQMYQELGLISDPDEYFHSLTTQQQDATFGKAGAQAIRDGADISQVVNARSGMSTASIGSRQVSITDAGTTTRGYYAHVQRALDSSRGQRTAYTSRRVGRRGAVANYRERRVVRPRLMPEQIYAIAGDNRDEALRLLENNGYVLGRLAALSTPPRHHGNGSGGGGGKPPAVPGPPGPSGDVPSLNDLVPTVDPTSEDWDRAAAALRSVIVGQYGRRLHIDDVTVTGMRRDGLSWRFDVLSPDGEVVGEGHRTATRTDGVLRVYHALLEIDEDSRGTGFSIDFLASMRAWYRDSGVNMITITAGLDDGGYSWAMAGFEWAHPEDTGTVLYRLRAAIAANAGTTAELRRARNILDRLENDDPGSATYPTPRDIATIGMQAGLDEWFGRSVMKGSSWHGILAP